MGGGMNASSFKINTLMPKKISLRKYPSGITRLIYPGVQRTCDTKGKVSDPPPL